MAVTRHRLPPHLNGVQGFFDIFTEEVSNAMLRKRDPIAASEWTGSPDVSYSHDLTFNASVGLLKDGRPRYTFNLGACLGLADACQTICCDPEFMQSIPLPPDGVMTIHSQLQPHAYRFLDYRSAIEAGSFTWPFDRVLRNSGDEAPRARLGNHLFEIATKLLSLHEQAHVLAGHLLFVSTRGSSKFQEIGLRDRSIPIAPADLRAMEFEADAVSLSIIASGRRDGWGVTTPRGLWVDEASSYIGFMRMALVASTLVVGILDVGDRAFAGDVAQRTHPSAGARLLNLIEMAVSLTKGEFASPEQGDEWLGEVLFECDRVLNALGCTRLDYEAIQEYFNPPSSGAFQQALAAETQEVQNDRTRLMPQLAPYKAEMARRVSS